MFVHTNNIFDRVVNRQIFFLIFDYIINVTQSIMNVNGPTKMDKLSKLIRKSCSYVESKLKIIGKNIQRIKLPIWIK